MCGKADSGKQSLIGSKDEPPKLPVIDNIVYRTGYWALVLAAL